MARLGFWFPVSGSVAGVLLYSGTDWQVVSGQDFLHELPPEVAARMLPEELAARQAWELRAVIGGLLPIPGVTSGQMDDVLPVVWAYLRERL